MVFEWLNSDTWSPSYGQKCGAAVLLQAAKEEEENSGQNPNGNHLLSKILHPTACTTKNKEFRENFVENRQIAKFRCQK
jgi:hypothetical protein